MEIVPAPRGRGWHSHIPATGACLPLTIANQAGWWLLNPRPFEVISVGGELVVAWPDGVPETVHVAAHFGHNILTAFVPYVFRTPPGWQLLMRGPSNYFYDGMQPFEGLVETDWHKATATMNWKVREGAEFVVEKDEPLAQIVPMRIDDLEAWTPSVVAMDSEHRDEYNAWTQQRRETLETHGKYEHGYRREAQRRKLEIREVEQ